MDSPMTDHLQETEVFVNLTSQCIEVRWAFSASDESPVSSVAKARRVAALLTEAADILEAKFAEEAF